MAGREHLLFQRELGGCFSPAPGLQHASGWGHQPLSFVRSIASDPAAVKRLAPIAELPANASTNVVAWSDDGQLLASGGEDCRVLLWDAQRQRKMHSLDMVCSSCSRYSSLHDFLRLCSMSAPEPLMSSALMACRGTRQRSTPSASCRIPTTSRSCRAAATGRCDAAQSGEKTLQSFTLLYGGSALQQRTECLSWLAGPPHEPAQDRGQAVWDTQAQG